MGYELEDENGYLADGPSIDGLRQLKKFFSSHEDQCPALTALLNDGYTTSTSRLSAECKRLVQLSNDSNVKITLKALATDARKAKGMVMLVM